MSLDECYTCILPPQSRHRAFSSFLHPYPRPQATTSGSREYFAFPRISYKWIHQVMFSFVSGFLCFRLIVLGHCVLSIVCSTPLLNSIQSQVHHFICGWTCGLLLVFKLWIIKQLWAFMPTSLCKCVFSFLLDKYLGMELPSHMVNICFIL